MTAPSSPSFDSAKFHQLIGEARTQNKVSEKTAKYAESQARRWIASANPQEACRSWAAQGAQAKYDTKEAYNAVTECFIKCLSGGEKAQTVVKLPLPATVTTKQFEPTKVAIEQKYAARDATVRTITKDPQYIAKIGEQIVEQGFPRANLSVGSTKGHDNQAEVALLPRQSSLHVRGVHFEYGASYEDKATIFL